MTPEINAALSLVAAIVLFLISCCLFFEGEEGGPDGDTAFALALIIGAVALVVFVNFLYVVFIKILHVNCLLNIFCN